MAAPSPADLRTRTAAVSLHDELRLTARLDALEGPRRHRGRNRDGDGHGELARIASSLEEAERRLDRRRAAVPRLTYPAALPVSEHREEILAAIRDHPVVILAGETGSGKSTQLPKLCLELGRGVRGMVGHTQPRRLAARTVAARVAEELGVEVGGAVGYAVRFTDRVGDTTLVKVMTDGILLAEVQRDPLLSRYDTIIVDEAHERSLNIDFLIGYLRQLQPRRPDLKLVITSATIDTERFSKHFDDAPVVQVSGRSFPVEVRYRPPEEERLDQDQAICEAVQELWAEGPGDALVFLSGEREIFDAADALRRLALPGTEVLPLYARLSAAEQHRIFEPHAGRRVVLATNVAETSLTVPGIRYVVDTGTARISRYSRRLKVQRLPIEAISQASADQRAGRCGRVAPGICIRLYDEDDLRARPEFTEPEILRTNLASVVLQMAALGLGEVAAFPFVEPPDSRSVADGMALLEELGALEPRDASRTARITPLGRRLARLPLDPRLGRMVLEADRQGCLREVMVLAAALSIQDPRERPAEHRQAADELHRRFADPDSDFTALLRLWEHLRERQKVLTSNQFRRECRAEYLNTIRVREWQDLYRQLRGVAADIGLHIGSEQPGPDDVHRALLAGLLSHVGMRDGATREFRGARGARFALAPGSALARKPPAWVVAGELVETNRLWGRTAARVQPEWIERLAEHLVVRTWSEPRWDRRRAAAVATERVTLWGLPLVTGRTIAFTRVDPAGARELFVRHALAEGDWTTAHAFVAANRTLLDQVRDEQVRARRREVLADDEALERFYLARVPAEATSGAAFDRWWKRTRGEQPDLLTATRELLLGDVATPVDREGFPDHWAHGELALELSYAWEPRSAGDGVTVHVPVGLLNRIDPLPFDWHVPGRREDLVVALIRTLPKPLRRTLVPARERAAAFVAAHGPADGPLLRTLSQAMSRQAAVTIGVDDWEPARLPDDLRVTFAVEDDEGRLLAAGTDLEHLRSELRGRVRAAIVEATAVDTTADPVERTGLTRWEVGELPRVVRSGGTGPTVEGYPALVDEGETVGVRVLATPAEQASAMWAGTSRLLLLERPGLVRGLERLITADVKLALVRTGHGRPADLVADALAAALDQALIDAGGPAWDQAGFEALRAAVVPGLEPAARRLLAAAGRLLVTAAALGTRLDAEDAPAWAGAVEDMRRQVARLVGPGFVAAGGPDRLGDLARYLEGVSRRLDKLPTHPRRDRDLMVAVLRLEAAHRELARSLPRGSDPAPLLELRWDIEDLRISFFAQTMGTARPVSEKRIARRLDEIRSGARG